MHIKLALGLSLIFTHTSASLARSPSSSDASAQPALYPKSYALVIGVNEPQGDWAPLKSAHDDAVMFAEHLERRGFQVTLLLGDDATKREILRQLQTQLPQQVSSEDRFIFYFAGHGQTQTLGRGKKLGYVVPADGIQSGQDEWHTYLSMRELRSLLTEHILSKHTLLIFDSCFSGLMFARGGLRRPSLSAKSYLKRRGVMAITAGGEGELALDGLFTPTLIQALSGEADENEDEITSFQEIALYTHREVKLRQNQQNPQFGLISGTGQMIFKSRSFSSDVTLKARPKAAQIPSTPTQPVVATTPSAQVGASQLSASLKSTAHLDSAASFDHQTIWKTTAITSGALSMVGAGLIWSAHSRYRELEDELDDLVFNQRVRSEGSEIVNTNNMGLIMLAVGGGSLIVSMYQLLTSSSASPEESQRSSAIMVKSNPLNRSAGFEFTW